MSTQSLKRLSPRYCAARKRLTATYAEVAEARAVSQCLARSVFDCRRIGLDGSALITAAEYMASTRLRNGVDALRPTAALAH